MTGPTSERCLLYHTSMYIFLGRVPPRWAIPVENRFFFPWLVSQQMTLFLYSWFGWWFARLVLKYAFFWVLRVDRIRNWTETCIQKNYKCHLTYDSDGLNLWSQGKTSKTFPLNFIKCFPSPGALSKWVSSMGDFIRMPVMPDFVYDMLVSFEGLGQICADLQLSLQDEMANLLFFSIFSSFSWNGMNADRTI